MPGKVHQRLSRHVIDFLQARPCAGKTLLLGLSGGLDSSALLHLLAEARQTLPFRLSALHVHHGLSPNADAWEAFCRQLCARYDIPLTVAHVQVPYDSGLGVEAAARELRYGQLLAASADWIVLAHHQDDQAETLLLQMLRGAGVKGLAAMAAVQDNQRLLRPLLGTSRAELEALAKEAGLQWIEDESNQDTRYDRNFCRHQVLPLLETRFPAARQSLARSAQHLAEASALLDQLAALDAELAINQNALDVEALRQLNEARGRNLVRWWLSSRLRYPPSSRRLQQVIRQLCDARDDAQMNILLDGERHLSVRRYQGMAYLVEAPPVLQGEWAWQGEESLQLPHGTLTFHQVRGQGLALERLQIARLAIKLRQGGERFKPAVNRPNRTLKHLLQEANMPPWERAALPLLYWQEDLAVVPGIGTASHLQAQAEEAGLVVTWQLSGQA